MSRGLTLEQMAFLVSKGVTAEEMLAFAEMGGGRSKAAERTARWRARKSGNVTETVTRDVTCDASPPPNDIYSNPLTSDEVIIPPAKRSKPTGLAKPDGVKDQTWQDFTALRKRKRADLTETALEAIRREAGSAGWSMESALAECVARGWQAFKADWVKDAPKPCQANSPATVDPLMRSIMAMKAREASP